mgnify:FL=1
MITGVIAREEHWKTIQALNFRGEHDIRRITAGSPNAAQRELEGNGEYNLLILDIDVFHGNSDIAVSLVERLKKSVPQLQLALIMDGYTSNSLVVRDIKSIGVEEDHIIFGGGAKLKQQINYILHETVQRKENEIDSPEEVKQIPQQLPPAGTFTPPSQIDRQSAKSMMIPKQPVRSDIPRAVTIAVAGAGPRMGTTTQAMQILNYLSTMEYKVAFVEMSGQRHMGQYLGILDKSEALDDAHFTLMGNHFYNDAKGLITARSQFDYVVCDYGVYNDIPDITSFFEKDVKIVCCGAKPWESPWLEPAFGDDDGTLRYIFSFVQKSDEAMVRDQMGDEAKNTYFAPYAPDFFRYCGADEIYERIIDPKTNRPKHPQTKGKRFWPWQK